MVKIHTKIKRKYRLCTSFRQTKLGEGKRKPRPKTFATEEGAKKWAFENELKEGSYDLIKVKKDKRFQVVKK
jgi:hypothetical protein